MTKFFIYKIFNNFNSKIYVGKTVNIEDRWRNHKSIARGGVEKYPESFSYIHAAIKDKGEINFFIEIIEECQDENIAYEAEVKWIKQFNSNNKKYGYNLASGGKGVMTGRPISLEVRKKTSETHKGRKRSAPIFTQNTTQKISKASKENKGLLTNDQKKEIIKLYDTGKFTKKQIGEKFNVRFETIRFVINYHKKYGFKTLEEKSNNMRKAKIGKKLTQEHKKNVSLSLRGRKVSEETRNKIAAALSGLENYTEIKEKVIHLIYDGNSMVNISKILNIKYDTVRSILRKEKNK